MMIASQSWSRIGSELGRLFEYPTEHFSTDVARCVDALTECPLEVLESAQRFVSELEDLSHGSLQELHTRTFVLAPSCVPYLGVYLFGEESFKRGDLLARLTQAFAIHSFDPGKELPDHIGIVLQFARHLDASELDELRDWMLALPLEKMSQALSKTQNPYRHLIEALRLLIVPDGIPDDVLAVVQASSGSRKVSSAGGCSPFMGSAKS